MKRLRLLFYLLSVASILLAITCLYQTRFGYGPIGKLMPGLKITHMARIVHGIDVSYIYEVSEEKSTNIDLLKSKLKVSTLAGDGDRQPMSVLQTSERPIWWPARWPEITEQSGYVNTVEERYASIWEVSDQQKVFVEIGQW